MELHTRLKLSPQYCMAPAGASQTVFLGEADSYVVSGGFAKLENGMSVGDFILPTGGIHEQAEAFYGLQRLVGSKVLQIESGIKRRDSPKTDDAGFLEAIRHGQIHRYDSTLPFIRSLLPRVAADCDNLVFLDDYLDPGISDTARSLRKESWVPLKLVGKLPLVGPLFRNGNPERPCFECVKTQLLRNQPVKRWMLREGFLAEGKMPIAYSTESVMRILPIARECLERLLAEDRKHSIYTIRREDLSFQAHEVRRLSSCPSCGNPGMRSESALKPIDLNPCLELPGLDGGSRSVSPQETVSRLEPFVSPITGMVCDVGPMSEIRESGIAIFRSAFFKTPASKQRITHLDFVQVCLGKGLTPMQSKASALCEAVERSAFQYRGDEYRFAGKESELGGTAIGPEALAFFSARQLGLAAGTGCGPAGVQGLKPYSPHEDFWWTICWSLASGERRMVPFTYCYANTPYDADSAIRFNSNGCASGNTLEEAILQGFYELVERDAAAIWWYNRIPRPAMDMSGLDAEAKGRIADFLRKDWDYWLLDLTHDFGIPVVAAVGKKRGNEEFRFGFGCHSRPETACHRALTELCQLAAIGDAHSREFDFRAIPPEAHLFPAPSATSSMADHRRSEDQDIAVEIRRYVRLMQERGYDFLVHDYSNPDLPLSAVKVIVPGLCHIWPQFGNERLYATPQELGWRTTRLVESELNPISLLL